MNVWGLTLGLSDERFSDLPLRIEQPVFFDSLGGSRAIVIIMGIGGGPSGDLGIGLLAGVFRFGVIGTIV